MDFNDPKQKRAFFEVHSGLPREGPGSRQSTERALRLAGPLPRTPKVLDLGCGPGMQTLDLAELIPDASFIAVDTHGPFLDQLVARATKRNLHDRIDVMQADMGDLPFEAASFDLIWCEGAAYFLGFKNALEAWAPMLRAQGKLAITEPVWLRSDIPDALKTLFSEYLAMTDVDGCRALVEQSSFKLLGDFVLPETDWLDEYFAPMKQRMDEVASSFRGNPNAELVLKECEEEIAYYEEFSQYYGYAFFVMSV